MYNKQVIDYAELLLKHKQAQQEQAQITPTIDVIENIDSNGTHKYCYEISDGVITTRMSTDFFLKL